jgi:hypothetical protein
MNGAIAIMVKTPGRSPIKTRLAASHGKEFAEQWHVLAANAIAAVVADAARSCGAVAYWAVAEDEALEDPCWATLPALAQGAGSLGTRMQHVHAELVARHGAGVLVGADSPQMSASLLRDALGWLREPAERLAIGPARDGGFWLFGANRTIAAERWEGVPYSRRDTAQRLRAAFEGCGAWLELPTLVDVDTGADVSHCLAALRALRAPHAAQRELLDWMAGKALAAAHDA